MKAFRYLVLFIISSVLFFLIFAWYSGFFKKIRVEVKEIGPFVVVYEDYIGEYSETAKIQDSIFNLLWEDGIENYKSFGIFYDDPKDTDIDKLRSRIGCVIEKEYIDRINRMKNKYNVFLIKRKKSAVIVFPYKNTFSVYAAIYKAYPKLEKFRKENAYKKTPIIEIYDIPNTITYILPLKKE